LSKPFDAAAKSLIDAHPLDWLRFFGLEGNAATVLDSDLNLPMTADRLIRVDDPDYLAHFELHGSRDDAAERRYMTYAVMAEHKYDLDVETIVIMMRRQADGPGLTGRRRSRRMSWDYSVYRLWEMSPEELLAGPPTVFPLVPLSNVTDKQMPGLILHIREQLGGIPLQEQKDLWNVMDLLMGLRYKPEETNRMLKGIYDMLDLSESTSYQRIWAQGEAVGEARGRAYGERRTLLRIGERRLGPPSDVTRAAIEAITSEQSLEELTDRILEIESWDDLLR
jgi:predicted transposase YdaD